MLPKRIVAFGASSCEGKVDVEGGGFIGRLRKWHEANDQHHHVYNLGISDDTTRGMLQRLEAEAKPRKPHLIIIQNGANDFIREDSLRSNTLISEKEFEDNIKKLLMVAKSMADVLFVSVYPIDESKTQPVSWRDIFYTLDDVKRNAEITKRICNENKVEYIDLFNEWPKKDYKKYLYEDGLHANSLGHEQIFIRIKAKLEALYK